MSLETKSVGFDLVEVKAGTDGWEFSGHVAAFDNVDHVEDVIHKGAFDASLATREFRPLLWSHNDRELPVGIEKAPLVADAKGLLGTWELLDTQMGTDVYKALKKNAVRTMSIGYKVAPGGQKMDGQGVRHLTAVDLLECSLVNIPANDRARVVSVKTLLDRPLAEVLAQATETLTYAVAEAKALHDRRAAEGRTFPAAHLEALDALLAQAEAALALKALRTDPDPAPAEAEPGFRLNPDLLALRVKRFESRFGRLHERTA